MSQKKAANNRLQARVLELEQRLAAVAGVVSMLVDDVTKLMRAAQPNQSRLILP